MAIKTFVAKDGTIVEILRADVLGSFQLSPRIRVDASITQYSVEKEAKFEMRKMLVNAKGEVRYTKDAMRVPLSISLQFIEWVKKEIMPKLEKEVVEVKM